MRWLHGFWKRFRFAQIEGCFRCSSWLQQSADSRIRDKYLSRRGCKRFRRSLGNLWCSIYFWTTFTANLVEGHRPQDPAHRCSS